MSHVTTVTMVERGRARSARGIVLMYRVACSGCDFVRVIADTAAEDCGLGRAELLGREHSEAEAVQ